MRARRKSRGRPRALLGPGKLCQALGITREHDGLALDEPPFELHERKSGVTVVSAERIGITKSGPSSRGGTGSKGSRYVSRVSPAENARFQRTISRLRPG